MKTEDIIGLRESQKVEFKSSFDKEAIISLVAFANTNGGKLIVGIDDKGQVRGIDIKPETEQRYLNAIKNATYPQILPNIDVFEISGQTILVFTINEYPVKPVSCKGRYYKRVKNSNHLLSLDEIVNLQLQSLNISYDAYPLNHDFKSLDIDLLEKFINQVNSMGRIKLNDDLLTNLTKLRLIQNGQPSLAAVLLFGNHGYSIHIGRFKSEETIIDDLLIKEPLMTALDEVMIFIKKHINLSFHFDGSLKRKEKWQYPIDVIRELLLNTVVHRDYKHTTDIVIKIFDDKIIFTNPGTLYGNLKLSDLEKNDYVSSIRNKLLAESFYLIGEIERYGTGFVRIRKELTDYPNISFQISEIGDFFKVEIIFSPNCDDSEGLNVSEGINEGINVSEGINEGLNEGLNVSEGINEGLNVSEGINNGLNQLVQFIENNPGKRLPELEKHFDLPAKTLERWIKIARNNGKIKFVGSKKTGGYIRISKNIRTINANKK